jgi:glycosyltransferase involved in cell wall biosynthesis
VKHVALVIPGIDKLGGAERQVISLARGLARRGWRVSVVGLTGTGGGAARELAAAGVAFVSLRMRKGIADPRGWLALARWIRRERPDILHAHLPHATWMARGVRLLSPVRAVVDTVHTSATGSRGQGTGYRLTGWLSEVVTAVSTAVADAYGKAGLVRADRVTVLPNGTDDQEWRPDAAVRAEVRKTLELANEFLWCAAGRLEPLKDYPTMLKAIAGLPETARLVIAGSGPQEATLRRLAESLGIAPRVRWLGFEPNMRPWLQAADGFVLSSLWEGLPVSLLEAGACGLPSVATAVAGSQEVVVDGATGYLAQPQDVDSLRRAMARLMQMRPESRRAMGMDARLRVEARFSLSSVLDRWEALYGELLEANPNPRRWASNLRRRSATTGFSGGTVHDGSANVRSR